MGCKIWGRDQSTLRWMDSFVTHLIGYQNIFYDMLKTCIGVDLQKKEYRAKEATESCLWNPIFFFFF